MTTVGDRMKFAIEYELNSESGNEWMFGRFCYWCAGRQIGDYEGGTSLRDVLFALEEATKWVTNRRSTRFCGMATADAFDLLRTTLFGDDATWHELAEQEGWARHIIAPTVDVFVGWKVFAIDCGLITKVIFAQDPFVDVQVVELETGQVARMLKWVCEELSNLHAAAATPKQSE